MPNRYPRFRCRRIGFTTNIVRRGCKWLHFHGSPLSEPSPRCWAPHGSPHSLPAGPTGCVGQAWPKKYVQLMERKIDEFKAGPTSAREVEVGEVYQSQT